MTKPEYLRFRKGDVLAIALVALVALVVLICFLPKSQTGSVEAQVYQEGALLKTLPLDADTSFDVVGKYTNTITVENGKIAITASDCPGEDCVRCGWMEHAGRSIVCLPNKVVVEIRNDQTDQPDVIS